MSRKRFEAFWQQEIVDRCCIAVTGPKRGCEATYWCLKSLPRLFGWGDPEAIVKRSRAQFAATCFGGESFPGIWLNLGPSGHAGYFQDVHYQVNDDSVWFAPSLHDSQSYRHLVFDRTGELYRMTMDLARWFVDDSQGDYFISMPDTAGNLDALAHLRGSEDLLMDLVTDPEEIPSALETIQQVWETVIQEVYALVQKNNDGGSMVYWLKCWAPGLHAQLQADISVMFSTDCYHRFIVPELQRQSAFLEYPLYHLDGAEQIRHLEELLSVEPIKAIQWTSVAGQKPPSQYLGALQRIQEKGKSLLISVSDPREVEPLLRNLSSKGLYLVLEADNEDQIEKIVHLAEKLTHD
ncbi:MAG: hypothetical protein AB9828_11590 [Sphaerochaetaceae bacterium]